MTIELPHELVWVNELCGNRWPVLDEDQCFAEAELLRAHARDLYDLDQDANWHASDLNKYNDAEFVGAFMRAWRRIRYNHGQSREASVLMADIAWSVGLAVQSAKTAMLGVLALTAGQVMRAKMTSSHIPGVAEDAFRAVKAGRIAVAGISDRFQHFLQVEITRNAAGQAMAILDQVQEVGFGPASPSAPGAAPSP